MQKYSFQVDTSISPAVSSLWLLQGYKKSDKSFCLVECNSLSDCYTATFSSDSSVLDNCVLYSKYFNKSELVSLKNTNLYAKECEYRGYNSGI